MKRLTLVLILIVLTSGCIGNDRANSNITAYVEASSTDAPGIPQPAPPTITVQPVTIPGLSSDSLNDEREIHEIRCAWKANVGHPSGRVTSIVSDSTEVKHGDLLVEFSSESLTALRHDTLVELQHAEARYLAALADKERIRAHHESVLPGLQWAVNVARGNLDARQNTPENGDPADPLVSDIQILESEITLLATEDDSPLKERLLRQIRDELDTLQLQRDLREWEAKLVTTRASLEVDRAVRALEQAGRDSAGENAIAEAKSTSTREIFEEFKTRYEQLKESLEGCKIYAPADGIVRLSRPWKVGDQLYPGQTLMTLDATAGNPPGPSSQTSLALPSSAIDRNGLQPSCLVIKGKLIERRSLTLGVQGEQVTEVQRGLTPGDHVIINPRDWPWHVVHRIPRATFASSGDRHGNVIVSPSDSATRVVKAVAEGTPVAAGQVVCELDTSDLQEQLFRARVAAADSEAQKVVAESTYAMQLASNATALADAEAAVRIAQAEFDLLGKDDEPGTFQARLLNLRNRIGRLRKEQQSAQVRSTEVEERYRIRDIDLSEQDREVARVQLLMANCRVASAMGAAHKLRTYTRSWEQLQGQRRIDEAQRRLAEQRRANESGEAIRRSELDLCTQIHAANTQRLERLRERIARCSITAPVEGEVRFLWPLSVGVTVVPGQALAVIEPESDGAADVGEKEAIAVPTSAVLRWGGASYIQAWEDGAVELRPVVIGRQTKQWTEVVNGLAVGMLVVRAPDH